MTVDDVQLEARTRLRIEAYRLMSEDVNAALAQPVEMRAAALQALADESKGKLSFEAGTHRVRLMGVTGTSTINYAYAADSWLRNAARRKKVLEDQLP